MGFNSLKDLEKLIDDSYNIYPESEQIKRYEDNNIKIDFTQQFNENNEPYWFIESIQVKGKELIDNSWIKEDADGIPYLSVPQNEERAIIDELNRVYTQFQGNVRLSIVEDDFLYVDSFRNSPYGKYVNEAMSVGGYTYYEYHRNGVNIEWTEPETPELCRISLDHGDDHIAVYETYSATRNPINAMSLSDIAKIMNYRENRYFNSRCEDIGSPEWHQDIKALDNFLNSHKDGFFVHVNEEKDLSAGVSSEDLRQYVKQHDIHARSEEELSKKVANVIKENYQNRQENTITRSEAREMFGDGLAHNSNRSQAMGM